MIALDHVTQFVKDRHRASSELRDQGLHAVEGGQHVGFGSANDLCYFGLFYLELLEITDPAEARASGSEVCRYAVDFLRSGEGLATLATETDDLEAVASRLRQHGYHVPDPVHMERVHADGFTSRSRIIYPQSADSPIRPPIVIERSVPASEREIQLGRQGIIAPHPAGDLRVDYIGVACDDALAGAQAVGSAYGAPTDTSLTRAGHWSADFAEVHFDRARLRFYQTSEADNPVSEQLTRRGPGPFTIGIEGPGTAVFKGTAHGADAVSASSSTWSIS